MANRFCSVFGAFKDENENHFIPGTVLVEDVDLAGREPTLHKCTPELFSRRKNTSNGQQEGQRKEHDACGSIHAEHNLQSHY